MARVITVLSLLFAVAVTDDQASHRVAHVEHYASRARGDERNRKHQREKPSAHDQTDHSMYFRAMEWTCPMHPEIVRAEPGSCPICGMALEPRGVAVDDDAVNPELADMIRRFWLAAAFTVPLFIVAMGDLLPGEPISRMLSPRTRTLLELGLATPVCLWSAWPFYVRFVQSLKNKSLNMWTLIGLGVSVAYGYSVVAALGASYFPRVVSRGGRASRGLLRSGRRDRHADLAGPSPRASRSQSDRGGDQKASRACGHDRAAHSGRR